MKSRPGREEVSDGERKRVSGKEKVKKKRWGRERRENGKKENEGKEGRLDDLEKSAGNGFSDPQTDRQTERRTDR